MEAQAYLWLLFGRFLWMSIGLVLFVNQETTAQQNPEKIRAALQDDVYTIVEKAPEFPGGYPALRDYLSANVQYPSAAKAANVKGIVHVSFIVRRDGQITDTEILKGLGFGCDEEAIGVVNAMQAWKPGSQSGQPLHVKFILPVLFGMEYPVNYPRRKGR